MAALLHRYSDKIEALRRVPLFSTLSKRDVGIVARHADEIAVPAGKVLAAQGKPGNAFYVIVRGSATVKRDGRKLAELQAGDFFGEMAVLDGLPCSATVVADEECVLLEMHRRHFSAILDDVPAITRKLLVGLSARLRCADKALVG